MSENTDTFFNVNFLLVKSCLNKKGADLKWLFLKMYIDCHTDNLV